MVKECQVITYGDGVCVEREGLAGEEAGTRSATSPHRGGRTIVNSSPDRIADPWGVRTPYAPGDPWPARTDLHLADGVTEEDVEQWVPSASILHSNGDAMDIAVRDGRIVGVRGRAADRVNRGRLGPKDLYGWQANHAPDRLTRPLVRENGRLVETDWDTALDRVAARTRTLLDERGPGSVGFYTSGQLFLEEYYTPRPRRRPHQPPRRQHPAVHGHRRRGPQGELRLRRPARLV